MRTNISHIKRMEVKMIEGRNEYGPPSDKLEEVRNDLAEIYKNEQLMGVAESDSTVCRLLERNIGKCVRLLSGLDPEKKIPFKFGNEDEKNYPGHELAKRFKEVKKGIKRIPPRPEMDYSLTDDQPYMKIHVGDYKATAHTKSIEELEMARVEASEYSWGEYKKELDELYEDMLRAIMLLDPKTFPWRDNVISDKMTVEKVIEMVRDAKEKGRG